MAGKNKQVSLVFVTETKEGHESDDRYLNCFAGYACRALLEKQELTVSFVHMQGIGNYKNTQVLADIRSKQQCNPFGPVYIVYAVDRDRVNKDKGRLDKIIEFISDNGYRLVVNCKSIEDAFGVRTIRSKHATAMAYRQEPDSVYKMPRFSTPLDTVRTAKGHCTNLGLVLEEILKDAAEWKPKT